MMVAMMLPAIAPLLRDHRLGDGSARGRRLLRRVDPFGAVVYPLGLALAGLEMRVTRSPARFPSWRVLHCASQACCSSAHGRRDSSIAAGPGGDVAATTPAAAWRHGLALGLRCCACCAPLTAALLVAGVMDLRAMAAATVAISLERLAPRGRAFARLCGVLLLGAGLTILVVVELE